MHGFEWFIVVLAFLIDLGAYAERDGSTPQLADAERYSAATVERIGDPTCVLGEHDEGAPLDLAVAERR